MDMLPSKYIRVSYFWPKSAKKSFCVWRVSKKLKKIEKKNLKKFWIFLEFTTTVVSNVYTTWGYNKIPIILFHVRSIWHQAVWSVSADSIRPNKTGTWLLIKCSFQNGPFSIKNMIFLISKNAFTAFNWAHCSEMGFWMEIWYENIQKYG